MSFKFFRKSRGQSEDLSVNKAAGSGWELGAVEVQPESPDPSSAYIAFRVEVRAVDTGKSYVYQGVACTPDGLGKHMAKHGLDFMFSHGLLLLRRYDRDELERVLQENIRSLGLLLKAPVTEEPAFSTNGWEIKDYSLFQTDLKSGPLDTDKFCDTFLVDVGVPGQEGVSNFQIDVGTPAGLLGENPYYFPAGRLVVQRFDVDAILKMVRENMHRLGSVMADVT